MEAECELIINEKMQPVKDRLYIVENAVNGNGTKGLKQRMTEAEGALETLRDLNTYVRENLKPRSKSESAKYNFKKAISVVGITSGTALIMKLIDVFFI